MTTGCRLRIVLFVLGVNWWKWKQRVVSAPGQRVYVDKIQGNVSKSPTRNRRHPYLSIFLHPTCNTLRYVRKKCLASSIGVSIDPIMSCSATVL